MQGITIIAEAGINHGGSKETATKMVIEAKKSGANAIKFQLFTELARPKSKKFILTAGAWEEIMRVARDQAIECFFSVFDFESVDLARNILGAKWVKLSFVERRNSKLIEKCNEVGFERKIVSIDLHGQYPKYDGWEHLYCPNNGWSGYYPTEKEHIEWDLYASIAPQTGIGYSCHSKDMYPCLVAASLGAKIIEKHFKINEDCPDGDISLNPQAFCEMVKIVEQQRNVARHIGGV